jgi:hypothetical protein
MYFNDNEENIGLNIVTIKNEDTESIDIKVYFCVWVLR